MGLVFDWVCRIIKLVGVLCILFGLFGIVSLVSVVGYQHIVSGGVYTTTATSTTTIVTTSSTSTTSTSTYPTTTLVYNVGGEDVVNKLLDKIDDLTLKVVMLENKSSDVQPFRDNAPSNNVNYNNYSARPMGDWEWLYGKGSLRLYSLRCYLNETLVLQRKHAGGLIQNPLRDIECSNLCYYLQNNPRVADASGSLYNVTGAYYVDNKNSSLLVPLDMSSYYVDYCGGSVWRLR
jgi:hypothetical protein